MRTIIVMLFVSFLATSAMASNPPSNTKSKFYDFSEQLIDGQIRKPSVTYTNGRDRVRFGRLLRLKRSFLPKIFDTARNRVFK